MAMGEKDPLLSYYLTSNCICGGSSYRQYVHCIAPVFSKRYVNTMYIRH